MKIEYALFLSFSFILIISLFACQSSESQQPVTWVKGAHIFQNGNWEESDFYISSDSLLFSKQGVIKDTIDATKPDVVFLDIQMPVMTGFDVLPQLEEYPNIIFSTAYDNYAIKAFEVHAVDYLLKPYTKKRFAKAIEKLSNSSRFEKQMQFIDESI